MLLVSIPNSKSCESSDGVLVLGIVLKLHDVMELHVPNGGSSKHFLKFKLKETNDDEFIISRQPAVQFRIGNSRPLGC